MPAIFADCVDRFQLIDVLLFFVIVCYFVVYVSFFCVFRVFTTLSGVFEYIDILDILLGLSLI